jgi:hypothetical protein
MADEKAQPSTPRPLTGAWDVLGPILGAIATGIGVLAFVALFGGAVLWDRADQVGLPAAEVVALMPHNSLLATGSYFLGGAVLLALVGVVVLWVVDTLLLRQGQQISEEAADAAISEVAAENSGEDCAR